MGRQRCGSDRWVLHLQGKNGRNGCCPDHHEEALAAWPCLASEENTVVPSYNTNTHNTSIYHFFLSSVPNLRPPNVIPGHCCSLPHRQESFCGSMISKGTICTFMFKLVYRIVMLSLSLPTLPSSWADVFLSKSHLPLHNAVK